ncbi:MAG: hypothetical protein HYT12_00485 [Candidatus Liptonbacteria bacterium]|nr:hypothetical protein [Candidatus Liptonbacteria bacterium]
MHGDLRLKVLALIENGIIGAVDFTDDLLTGLTAPYGSSFRHMEYTVMKNRRARERMRWEEEERQRIYDLLYRLRKDGLIMPREEKQHKHLRLTAKGVMFLNKLKLRKQNMLPTPQYKSTDSDSLKIVAFDVPEKERGKRAWLRSALSNLEFQMVQKSLWIGKHKLPAEFMDDLLRLRIIAYIEIFAVSKRGTLRRVI